MYLERGVEKGLVGRGGENALGEGSILANGLNFSCNPANTLIYSMLVLNTKSSKLL